MDLSGFDAISPCDSGSEGQAFESPRAHHGLLLAPGNRHTLLRRSGASICAMPRPPGRSLTAAALRGSPYSSLLARMATHRGEIFPLHVGDTWRQAPEGGRPEELPRGIPGINRYTDVHGLPELRDAIAARTRTRAETCLLYTSPSPRD